MCLSPNFIKIPDTDLRIFDESQRFLSVPCGKCSECRKNYSKNWAVRLMLEYDSRTEEEKKRCWFLTLTYDEEHNPVKLNDRAKRDITLFWKRLRKYYPNNKIKYFYCGEYGSKTNRPHFHVIVYNLPINDLVFYKYNKFKDMLFKSDFLSGVWKNGYVVVGSLTLGSCEYTARYCIKKNNTDCYSRVSNGIGKQYFLDNMNVIIRNDYVSIAKKNGKIWKANIPKYFLKLYRKILNNDVKYSKFIKAHMKNKTNWKNDLIKKFWPDKKYLWESNMFFKELSRQIGMNSKTDDIQLHIKKCIAESMDDIIQYRDF